MPTGIENQVRNLLRDPTKAGNILDEVEAIARAAFVEVATEVTAGEGAGAADAAIAGAEGLSATMGFIVLLGVIAACVLSRLVERGLLMVAGKVPFGWGSKLQDGVRALWWPVDTIENTVISSLEQQARDAWDGFQFALNFFFGVSFQTTNAGKTTVTQGEITHLQHEVDTTNARITALNTRLNNLAHSTVGVQASPTPNLKPLEQTVREQGWAIQRLYDNQTGLYNDTQTLLHNQRILRHDLDQLQKQLVGIRTVQTGWVDIVDQIQALETTLNTRTATNTANIATLNHRVTNLSPLTLLLQPGLRGLRVLRSLEDKPCQCPGFPNLNPPSVEALAIELAVANGV